MLNLNCSVNILVCICISSHHLITGVDIACLHVYDLTYYVVFFFTPAPLYTNSCFTSLCPPHFTLNLPPSCFSSYTVTQHLTP